MRELVLNHASLAASRPADAFPWLVDLARGIAALVGGGVVPRTLRMAAPKPDRFSYFDACQELLRHGERDAYVFLAGLGTKSPLLDGVAEGIEDRFRACEAIGCETITLAPRDGEPLVLCALDDGIAVGVPSAPIWDRDRLTVHFHELLSDESGETIEEASENIDNLARAVHADSILERHHARLLRRVASGRDLWARREQLFPHLLFGPEVEGHLDGINVIDGVVNRLVDLDRSAATWESDAVPDWTCNVSTESSSVRNTPKLWKERRFKSITGDREVFELHARYGKGGRIHLRVDGGRHLVEIGYIGKHLPTKMFP